MPPLLILVVALGALLSIPSTSSAASLAPPSRQVLKVGVFQPAEGGSLDPSIVSYLDAVNLHRLAFRPLYDARANGTLAPVLAAGSPVVSSNRRSVTVRLRAARWSDGRPIVAADVVTAFARSKRSYFQGFLINVQRVVAVNARTVRFDLRRSDPVVVAMLTSHILSPVPTHVIARAGNRWTAPGTIVSSGPFRLESRSATKWTFVKNARYFAARSVRLARVEVHVTRSKAQLFTGMRRGTFDTTLQSVFAPDTSFAGTAVVTESAPTQGTQYLYLNTRTITDVGVRRGIALAVDRAGIAGLGRGEAVNAIVPSTMPLANVASAGPRLLGAAGTPDTAAAAQQLAAGAWSGRSLRLAYVSDSGNAAKMAVVVRDSLGAVGVPVTLVPMSGDAFSMPGFGISPTRSTIDMILQGWIVDYPDLWDFYQLFKCANVQSGLNNANYCNASYDALASPLASQFTPTARGATFAKLEQRLTGPEGAFPAVPLYRQNDRVYRQSWLRAPLPTLAGNIQWDQMAIEVH